MSKKKLPSYCLHKPTNQGYCRVKGRFIYFGEYGTEEAREAYDKFIVEYLQAGRQLPPDGRPQPGDLAITSLCLAYTKYIEGYGYAKNELEGQKVAIRRFRKVYGRSLVRNFGPLNLQAFQQFLVEEDCSRVYVNKTIERITRMCKWGCSQELVPSNIYEAIRTVEGLKRGRTTAKEYEPVQPVSDYVVDKTIEYLPPTVADMVRFQRFTGCRSGEMVIMRPIDIDRSGEVWVYTPSKHKTEHFGKKRQIYIGPKAQGVLAAYLMDREPTDYVFSPVESEKLRAIDRRRNRQSPMTPSQQARGERARTRQRAKPPGECYTTGSYRKCIVRATKLARKNAKDKKEAEKIVDWSPHQLRHSTQLNLNF